VVFVSTVPLELFFFPSPVPSGENGRISPPLCSPVQCVCAGPSDLPPGSWKDPYQETQLDSLSIPSLAEDEIVIPLCRRIRPGGF